MTEHIRISRQRTVGRPSSLHRTSRRARERSLDHHLPEVFDLFVVAVEAGHLPANALRLIQPWVHRSVGAPLREVCDRIDRGEAFVDSLESLTTQLGTRALAFVATLTLAERSGQPLSPVVERIAHDAREQRRRSSEIEARQLPIRLSFPLVVCTLPSFAMLSIAPMLIGALSSLRFL